jgi:hypothetical protein
MQLQKKTFLALASDFAKIEGETPSFLLFQTRAHNPIYNAQLRCGNSST